MSHKRPCGNKGYLELVFSCKATHIVRSLIESQVLYKLQVFAHSTLLAKSFWHLVRWCARKTAGSQRCNIAHHVLSRIAPKGLGAQPFCSHTDMSNVTELRSEWPLLDLVLQGKSTESCIIYQKVFDALLILGNVRAQEQTIVVNELVSSV